MSLDHNLQLLLQLSSSSSSSVPTLPNLLGSPISAQTPSGLAATSMLPTLPLAAALLDQYALLTTASVLSKQQRSQQQQETASTILNSLWPSWLYGRLMAAGSSTAMSPTTPSANNGQAKKYRNFTVSELLGAAENNDQAGPSTAMSPPTRTQQTKSLSPDEATMSPRATPSSSSVSLPVASSANNEKWLSNSHGPLEELCKLASRPIVEEGVDVHSISPFSSLVSQMVVPPSSTGVSRAITNFGAGNVEPAGGNNFAAYLQQQHRLRQATAAAAVSRESISNNSNNNSNKNNSNSNFFRHHHRFNQSSSTNKRPQSKTLNSAAIQSFGLVRRKRKTRTSFTPYQIAELEKRFFKQKYLTSTDRDDLASGLNLTAGQVITWFQNRRAKLKRDIEEIKGDMKLEGDGQVADDNEKISCRSLASASPSSSAIFEEENEHDLSLINQAEPLGLQLKVSSTPCVGKTA